MNLIVIVTTLCVNTMKRPPITFIFLFVLSQSNQLGFNFHFEISSCFSLHFKMMTEQMTNFIMYSCAFKYFHLVTSACNDSTASYPNEKLYSQLRSGKSELAH